MSTSRTDLDGDIFAYLADDLDAAAHAALERSLIEDPAAAQRFIHLCQHELALATVLHSPRVAVRPAPRRRQPSARTRHGWWWAAAAVLVIAISAGMVIHAGGSASRSERSQVATISEVHGASTVDGLVATPGMPLAAGARMQVGMGAGLAFTYADGTRLDLDADSQAVVQGGSGKLVALDHGSLQAAVAPQPVGYPLRVETPLGQAEVVGTRFHLTVAAAATRLEVSVGKVRLSRASDGASCVVQAGYASAVTRNGGPLILSWLDQLTTHLPQHATVMWQADLAGWEGEHAAPPGYSGIAAVGSHAPQPGTRFMGEVRSPLLIAGADAGVVTGPDRYLALRYLAAGFRPGDRMKFMLKSGTKTYHGLIQPTGDIWDVAVVRLDGSFVDLNSGVQPMPAAQPMPVAQPISQIVLLPVAPDGEVGIAGPRLWLGEMLAFTTADAVVVRPVGHP